MTIPDSLESVRINGDEIPLARDALQLMERSGRLSEADAAVVTEDLRIIDATLTNADLLVHTYCVNPYSVKRISSAIVHRPEVLRAGLDMLVSLSESEDETALSGLIKYRFINRQNRRDQRTTKKMLDELKSKTFAKRLAA